MGKGEAKAISAMSTNRALAQTHTPAGKISKSDRKLRANAAQIRLKPSPWVERSQGLGPVTPHGHCGTQAVGVSREGNRGYSRSRPQGRSKQVGKEAGSSPCQWQQA